jgi:hypothetical protein
MDYADDKCMDRFTPQQVHHTINKSKTIFKITQNAADVDGTYRTLICVKMFSLTTGTSMIDIIIIISIVMF